MMITCIIITEWLSHCCDPGERVGMSSSVSEYVTSDDVSASAAAAAAASAPLAAAAATVVSVISDYDDSLQQSCTLPPVDDEMQSVDTTGDLYFLGCVNCMR